MPGSDHGAEHGAAYAGGCDEREGQRLQENAAARASMHIHDHYLKRYIVPGMDVLNASAASGPFSVDLTENGVSVTAAEISAARPEGHAEPAADAGCEAAAAERAKLDLTGLGDCPGASFDAVVCFGGAVSFAMNRGADAVRELLRVLKPGGPCLLSVMSRVGAMRVGLECVLEEACRHGVPYLEQGLTTGAFASERKPGRAMKLYVWREFKALLLHCGARILSASASNHLTTVRHGSPDLVERLWKEQPDLWAQLLEWEIEVCAEPGNLDGGSHIIAVVTRD